MTADFAAPARLLEERRSPYETGGTNHKAVPSVGLIWAGFIALRRRAYRQATPWFVLSFSALFAIVIVVAFWPATLMWFALAAPAGAMLLLVGLIAPTKRLGEA